MKLFGKTWRLRRVYKVSQVKFVSLTVLWCVVLASLGFGLNYMGVFTHLFERDYYEEFSYPLHVDLQPLVKDLISGRIPSIAPINKFDYTFQKSCHKKCSYAKPKLLFVIKSAMPHFEQRAAIRETWGNEQQFLDVEVRRIFLLGIGTNAEIQRKLDLEDLLYGDIVQANFYDNYRNNTLKTMSGLKWAVENCPSLEFVLFSDDDMYISAKNVLRYIQNPSKYPPESQETPPLRSVEHRERSLKQEVILNADKDSSEFPLEYGSSDTFSENLEHNKLYAGYVFHSAPLRHKLWNKWYISLEEYPFHLWPPYATAGAYIVSRDALLDLHYGSFYTKYFQFDDIFLALVALKMNITPIHCSHFHFWGKSYTKLGYRDVIASHGYSDPDELRRVWNEQREAGYA